MKQYCADFETTSVKNFEIEKRVRVWGVNVREITTNKSVLTSNNIDDFFSFFEKQSAEVFFHNLKFDGHFIIYWLLTHGYSYTEEPKEKCFSTLITSMGTWYEVTIYHKIFDKRVVKTTIRDSLKKLNMSVRTIAKSFKLDTLKGEIDYVKFREENYQMSPEELDYLENDTSIVAQALKIQFEKGLDKMTIGADALSHFKQDIGLRQFEYLFPVINKVLDDDIRQSYKGGFTYLNPEFQNKELTNVSSYDVNSLYPYVMHDCFLPFGEPKIFTNKYTQDKRFPLYIQCMKCKFELKPNHIPTIQLKNNFRFCPTEYLTSSEDELIYLALTNVDEALFLKHYNVTEIEYLGGVKFRGARGIFNEYIDYWSEIKKESEGGLRQLAKLMLNSLYGKFGTNPRRCSSIPVYDEENDIVKFKKGEETIDNPVYTALACFVTAEARSLTISSCQKNYPLFVYADTDSMHIIANERCKNCTDGAGGLWCGKECKFAPVGIEIDAKTLGAWKFEGCAERAKFLRAKTYIKVKDGKTHVTCAGMPDTCKEQVTFENFNYNSRFKGKLQQQKVSGGVLLGEIEFTIKEV